MHMRKQIKCLVLYNIVHFIFYINRLIATELDLTYSGYQPTAHNIIYLVAAGGLEPATSRSLVKCPVSPSRNQLRHTCIELIVI